MRILVINTPNKASRRAFQQAQATRLGLELEFINAVSVDDLPARVLQNAANDWTRGIRAQDVACTFSHWRAWEIVSEQTEQVCVLEDDVLLSERFKDVLDYIERRRDDWSCVYDLEFANYKHNLSRSPVWRNAGLNVAAHRIFKNKRGAAAYVLGPKAAQRLLREANGYRMLEAFLWTRRWMRQLQIEPCQAVQLDVFDPNASFGRHDTQHRTTKIFRNTSWVAAKLKRLALSVEELPLVVPGLAFGQRRSLRICRDDYLPPENTAQDSMKRAKRLSALEREKQEVV
ncbi:glycosyltransferase family 25 protein [Ruegeria sp. R13_0]|uniref:glycosyltransferase family 25 protein n=1 Tax=Ruegeria sp. R13_0 TaxID=2821099 RepID=UPI001ADB8C05|nr:glycosyltransferase family 25 protein [Ruegeria sp. R13_0]MBO9433416.1 glycosyltransferase family 25 protein [Ruegeria sp. R13_0]